MEDYADFKNGKRVVAQRKMFPGYLLVRAALDDQAWFVIRNTPGVTGFVGQGAKPSPLPRRDVESFLMPKGGTEEQVAQRAKPRLEYEIGETVRVKEGPFADFSGEVIELNEDQLKLKVLVNIFGRETPVELEFSKVAKRCRRRGSQSGAERTHRGRLVGRVFREESPWPRRRCWPSSRSRSPPGRQR